MLLGTVVTAVVIPSLSALRRRVQQASAMLDDMQQVCSAKLANADTQDADVCAVVRERSWSLARLLVVDDLDEIVENIV